MSSAAHLLGLALDCWIPSVLWDPLDHAALIDRLEHSLSVAVHGDGLHVSGVSTCLTFAFTTTCPFPALLFARALVTLKHTILVIVVPPSRVLGQQG